MESRLKIHKFTCWQFATFDFILGGGGGGQLWMHDVTRVLLPFRYRIGTSVPCNVTITLN